MHNAHKVELALLSSYRIPPAHKGHKGQSELLPPCRDPPARKVQGIQGPAGTGTGTTWANIDRPEWTSFIGYGNAGPHMVPYSPFILNNLVLNESLMPGANKNYNLGQDQRR